MDKLKHVVFRLSGGNRKVFGLILLSATYVILARLLAPLIVSWDLSIQLESSYRLTQGLGLTNASLSHFDLNQPPISQYLTHFPPGLALSVAALLMTGAPLAIALKTIYGLTTVAGWIGWASISSRCLIGPVKVGRVSWPVHLIIATALPIFYTPSWTIQGTDIFLWAGIPIVLLLAIYRPMYRFVGDRTAYTRYKIYDFYGQNILAILLGLVIGYLITVRYSSAFLILVALLVIAHIDFPKVNIALRRFATACLSCSLFLLPMIIYVKLATQATRANSVVLSNNNPLHTHRALSHRASDSGGAMFMALFEAVEKNFSSFSNLYILTGLDSARLGSLLEKASTFADVLGLAFFLTIIALLTGLVLKIKGYFSGANFLVGLLSTVISFVTFSMVMTFVLAYSPLQIARYYQPVAFCLILVIYRIATLFKFQGWMKYARHAAVGLIFTFTLYNLILKPADRLFLDSESDLMSPVLASGVKISDIPYPSNRILSLHEDSVDYLNEIQLQKPNALFFVQAYARYMSYLEFENSSRFRRIPDADFWKNAYLSEPAQIFWVINNPACSLICASGGNFNSDSPQKNIDALLSLPNLKTVFASQEDGTSIMVSDLPAGYRFDNSLDSP